MLTLTCHDSRKSFYNKASVEITPNNTKILYSYNTPICAIKSDNTFIRLWDGYSVTTMRHVNSFLKEFGISGGGKSWWDKQRVETLN